MYYSAIGLLAALVLLAENYDILFKRNRGERSAQKAYRGFLFWVLVYYVIDALWGVLEAHKLATALFIDTMIYFIAMAIGVLYWARYTVVYLNEKSVYGKALLYVGNVVFAGVVALTVANIFTPVMFYVDADCVYHATFARYGVLATQIVLFLLVSGRAFYSMAHNCGALRKRYRTIACFGLIMTAFLTAQLWFPYLPMYSIAYMVGTCLLRTFVVNDEKEEYKQQLEKALKLAYKDALTGVKSKLAYFEEDEKLLAQIRKGEAPAFAIAVFDVNDLKEINDKEGHEQGDRVIVEACRMICEVFLHSPVFRIGGDEFAAILTGGDYEHRETLQKAFEHAAAASSTRVAMGMSDYRPGKDATVLDVFKRADSAMYRRKKELKAAQ